MLRLITLLCLCWLSVSNAFAQEVAISYDRSGNRIKVEKTNQPIISAKPDSLLLKQVENDTFVVVNNLGTGVLEWKASNEADWITLKTTEGKEKDTLFLKVIANPSRTSRASNVIISEKNDKVPSFKLFVRQDPIDNTPPAIKAIPDLNFRLGFTKVSIDLDTVFTDADQDELSYEQSLSTSNIVNISISDDNIAEISELGEGLTEWVVKATDGFGGEASDTVMIKVSSDPILTVSTDSIKTSFAATNQSFQISNQGSADMSWRLEKSADWISITSNTSGVNSGEVIVQIDENETAFDRSAEIIVIADGATGSPKKVVVFQLCRPNNAPEILKEFEDLEMEVNSSPKTLNLTEYFTDPDATDELNYKVELDVTGIITTSLENSDLVLSPGVAAGLTNVTVFAFDRKDTESDTFTVTLTEISEAVLLVDKDTIEVDASAQDIAFNISNGGQADLSWNMETAATWLTLPMEVSGTNGQDIDVEVDLNDIPIERAGIIYIRAEGARNELDSVVVIQEAGAFVAPRLIELLPDTTVLAGADDIVFDLREYFKDENPVDEMTFNVASSNSRIVSINLQGSQLKLTPVSTNGFTDLTVTATNPHGSIQDVFRVSISPVTSIDDPTIEDGVRVSPNPSNGWVKLDLTNYQANRPNIDIIDSNGKVINTIEQVVEKIINLDMRFVHPGTYNIAISSEKGVVLKKVIIKREP